MQTRHGIFFQSASAETRNELNVPSGYHWGSIDETCILNDPIFAAKDRRAKARARLADGHSCYGFFDQSGAMAYYMWVTVAYNSSKAVPWELNTQLLLKPKTGYFWDCFTAPEHRRRGLYRAGLQTAIALTKAQSAQRSYICCLRDNIPSLKAILSSGFCDLFSFSVRRVGPLVLCKRDDKGSLIGLGSPRFRILD